MALARQQTVALALSQLGTAEAPPHSNRVKYSQWYGLVGPWCAMFLSWVLAHAGNTSGYRFASTASSVAWARQRGRLVPVADALPGDVVVRLYTTTTGHTGMVTKRPLNGRLMTCEGNTSGSNDRDGGMVMHRDRAASWWQYCMRLDYPAAPPMTGGNVTVFRPPLDLPHPIASTANDPVGGGAWVLLVDGSVYTTGSARYLGGTNGKNYWGNRVADRLEVTTDGRYSIIATTGERYGPSF